VDAAGNLYIAEVVFNRVRKVSASGAVTIVAGGSGASGYSGDGGPAREARLNQPYGVAVSASGDVYIADSLNNAVRLLTPVAGGCSYSLALTTFGVPAPPAGEDATLTITTTAGCSWAVSDLPDWITVTGPSSGSGTGTTALVIAANSGDPRSATISVAGLGLPVAQASSLVLINSGGVVNAAGNLVTYPTGTTSTTTGTTGTTGTTTGTTGTTLTVYMPGSPVPGSLISIYGNFLLPAPVSATAFPIPDMLGGLSFQFGGAPAAAVPLLYASGTQVNAQVPWELQGQSQTTLAAASNGQISAPQVVNLAAYSPGIFAINGDASGQGAILDSTNRLVDATNPATAGTTVVQIFCTGLGPVSNQPATGAPAPSNPPAQTTTTPTVTIGGVPAIVQFSGLAPGAVGLYQVNIQVPRIFAYSNAVPVMISIGGITSNAVTMAVQ
jgi:uncharacterized protein (TIGR03437 family)